MEVFSEPLSRRYRASCCSWAVLCNLFLWIVVIVIPYVWAFTSESFWLKQSLYREQPAVAFNHKMVVKLDIQDSSLDHTSTAAVWSTEPAVKTIAQDTFRPAIIMSNPTDTNRDSKYDVFNITIDFPLSSTEAVVGAQLIAFFDYQLSDRAMIQMESLAIFQGSTSLGASRLTLDGVLEFDQRSLLWTNGGLAVLYDDERLLDTNGFSSLQDVLPSTIIAAYNQRNFSTQFKVPYPVWTPSPPSTAGATDHFVIEMVVRNTIQNIEYIPNLAEMLKFAWIQYLAMFVIVFGLVSIVKILVYPNQVFETEVLIDQGAYRGPKQHHF